jgi:hypothetical protein
MRHALYEQRSYGLVVIKDIEPPLKAVHPPEPRLPPSLKLWRTGRRTGLSAQNSVR